MTTAPGASAEQGIGAQLRAARERAGLTSLQAAAKLHLEPRMIEALESDDFAALGAPVYVRGHLRRYAELLDAPVETLLARYAAAIAEAAPPDLAQLTPAKPMAGPRQLAGPVVAVIVAGTVIAGIWLALKGLPTATLPGNVTPEATRPAVAPPAASPPATEDTNAGAPAAALLEAPAAAAVDAAVAPPAGEVRLRLAVRSDSWVEVYDARDARLYFGLAHAPTTVSRSGVAPLRVLLGYAEGVAVEVDGHALTLPATARRGRSARFIVAADGTLSPVP